MTSFQCINERHINNWLKSKPIVIASYCGNAKHVNLKSMLRIWQTCSEDGLDFKDCYPDLSDNFEAVVVEDEITTLPEVMPKHWTDYLHVKVWIRGDEVNMNRSDI